MIIGYLYANYYWITDSTLPGRVKLPDKQFHNIGNALSALVCIDLSKYELLIDPNFHRCGSCKVDTLHRDLRIRVTCTSCICNSTAYRTGGTYTLEGPAVTASSENTSRLACSTELCKSCGLYNVLRSLKDLRNSCGYCKACSTYRAPSYTVYPIIHVVCPIPCRDLIMCHNILCIMFVTGYKAKMRGTAGFDSASRIKGRDAGAHTLLVRALRSHSRCRSPADFKTGNERMSFPGPVVSLSFLRTAD